jgi:aconitate hydratase
LAHGEPVFKKDEFVFIPNLKSAILEGKTEITAYAIGDVTQAFTVKVGDLTAEEKSILTDGCLINNYRSNH